MPAMILFAMTVYAVQIGWYGTAICAFIAMLCSMRWLWTFITFFFAGRAIARTLRK